MGVQVIPIPTEVVSHSLSFPFPILCFIPIPMGFPVPLGIPFPCTSLPYTHAVRSGDQAADPHSSVDSQTCRKKLLNKRRAFWFTISTRFMRCFE